MFSKIKDILEDNNILVCVLIDEVESLAHARDQCVSGKFLRLSKGWWSL